MKNSIRHLALGITLSILFFSVGHAVNEEEEEMCCASLNSEDQCTEWKLCSEVENVAPRPTRLRKDDKQLDDEQCNATQTVSG